MTRKVVSAEDAEELKRQYEQLALATFRASAALVKEGMESPKFKRADKEAGKAWHRIRMILRDSNSYWM
jgi:hypothetical protein